MGMEPRKCSQVLMRSLLRTGNGQLIYPAFRDVNFLSRARFTVEFTRISRVRGFGEKLCEFRSD